MEDEETLIGVALQGIRSDGSETEWAEVVGEDEEMITIARPDGITHTFRRDDGKPLWKNVDELYARGLN